MTTNDIRILNDLDKAVDAEKVFHELENQALTVAKHLQEEKKAQAYVESLRNMHAIVDAISWRGKLIEQAPEGTEGARGVYTLSSPDVQFTKEGDVYVGQTTGLQTPKAFKLVVKGPDAHKHKLIRHSYSYSLLTTIGNKVDLVGDVAERFGDKLGIHIDIDPGHTRTDEKAAILQVGKDRKNAYEEANRYLSASHKRYCGALVIDFSLVVEDGDTEVATIPVQIILTPEFTSSSTSTGGGPSTFTPDPQGETPPEPEAPPEGAEESEPAQGSEETTPPASQGITFSIVPPKIGSNESVREGTVNVIKTTVLPEKELVFQAFTDVSEKGLQAEYRVAVHIDRSESSQSRWLSSEELDTHGIAVIARNTKGNIISNLLFNNNKRRIIIDGIAVSKTLRTIVLSHKEKSFQELIKVFSPSPESKVRFYVMGTLRKGKEEHVQNGKPVTAMAAVEYTVPKTISEDDVDLSNEPSQQTDHLGFYFSGVNSQYRNPQQAGEWTATLQIKNDAITHSHAFSLRYQLAELVRRYEGVQDVVAIEVLAHSRAGWKSISTDLVKESRNIPLVLDWSVEPSTGQLAPNRDIRFVLGSESIPNWWSMMGDDVDTLDFRIRVKVFSKENAIVVDESARLLVYLENSLESFPQRLSGN